MKVLVASHRRSGTHLTIDSISNNASYDFGIHNFDKVRNGIGLEEYGNRNMILKSHMNGDAFDKHEKEFLEKNIRILYAFRDGRGVMQSLYNYENKDVDFPSFINEINKYDTEDYIGELTRLEYWAFHVKSWLSKEYVTPVKFEDLRSSYESTIDIVFSKMDIDLKSKKIKDIRQTNRLLYYFKKYIAKQKLTTVKFNSGKVSSFTRYFDEDLNKQYQDVLVKYEIDSFFRF